MLTPLCVSICHSTQMSLNVFFPHFKIRFYFSTLVFWVYIYIYIYIYIYYIYIYLFMYSQYESFIWYVIWKYFPSLACLFRVFHRAKYFNFDEVQYIYFLLWVVLFVCCLNSSPSQRYWKFSLFF